MIRKALRVVVAGACLLSLLLCVGAGLAWCLTGRYGEKRIEVAYRSTKVLAFVNHGGFSVTVVRGWPGPPGFWAQTYPESDLDGPTPSALRVDFYIVHDNPTGAWGPFARWTESGRAFLGPDGRVRRGTASELANAVVFAPEWLSGPLPCESLYVDSWFVIALFGLLPLLWIGTAGRRRLTVRRRRRLGQCLASGYDLRSDHSACPECGRAI